LATPGASVSTKKGSTRTPMGRLLAALSKITGKKDEESERRGDAALLLPIRGSKEGGPNDRTGDQKSWKMQKKSTKKGGKKK